jgi:hypothetical protein
MTPLDELIAALRDLRINANRLCDRNLGGTYEDDCRRSIARADAALKTAGEQCLLRRVRLNATTPASGRSQEPGAR